MKHIFEGKEIEIDSEQVEVIDNHGSGCVDWMVKGYDSDGVKYWADGNYQDGELMDISDIEVME